MTITHTQNALSYADFTDGPGGDTATLSTGDYTVTIWRDDGAENPWDDCDGMTPWFNKPSRNQCGFDYGEALNVTAHLPAAITWQQFRAALNAIEYGGDIADLCYDAAHVDVKGYDSTMAAWRELRTASLVDIVAELIAEQGYTASDIEAIEALYNVLGVPCESFASCGYSQGDYVEGLWVATPRWIAETGINPDTHDWAREWETSKRLLSAWLWGDVWGFTIEREGEYLESCGGFYSGPLWDSDSDLYIFEEITDFIEADKRGRAA